MKVIEEEVIDLNKDTAESNIIMDKQYKKDVDKNNKEAVKSIDPKEAKNRRALFGADKQPEPKKVEEPKATLDESLFEDTNYDMSDIKRWVFESLDNMLEGNGGVEDNLAMVMHSQVDEYDLSWAPEEFYFGLANELKKARENYINALMKMLFINAPVEESLKENYHDYPGWDFIEETLIESDLSVYDTKEEFIDEMMDFFSDYQKILQEDGVDFDKIQDRLEEYWDDFYADSVDDIEEGYGNRGSKEWQALSNKESKKDKDQDKGLFSRVDNELTAQAGPYEMKAPSGRRYLNVGMDDKGLLVYAPTEKDLEHAKNVAKHFGLECEISSVPGNQGTKTAYKAIVVIPEDMYDETPEQTKARLNK